MKPSRPVAKRLGRRMYTGYLTQSCECASVPNAGGFFFQLDTHGDEGKKSHQKCSDHRKCVGNCQRCGHGLWQEQDGMRQAPEMRVGLTAGSVTKSHPSLKSNLLSLLNRVSLQLRPHQVWSWSCVSR